MKRRTNRAVAGSGKYVWVKAPGYPGANAFGSVYEHVIVAERALGRALPERANIHHVNGIKNDNRPSNLVLCEDHKFHMLLHKRAEAYAACGDADKIRCCYCDRYFSRSELTIVRHGRNNERGRCRPCSSAKSREWRRKQASRPA